MRPASIIVSLILLVSFSNCDAVSLDECPDGVNNSTGNCIIKTTTTTTNETSKNNATTQMLEVTTLTPSPVVSPKSMAMLAEDHQSAMVAKDSNTTEEPKGRALNFTLGDHTTGNILSANSSSTTRDKLGDLSDVSIHDDEDVIGQAAKILSPKVAASSGNISSTTMGICEKGGLTYEEGEKLEIDCDQICTCQHGKMDCADRCSGPFFRRGKKINDPLCTAKDAEDSCCSLMVCAADTETEPLEICSYNNRTYNRGETFHKGCEEVCICEIAGKHSCKPRCAPIDKTSDRCVEVQDPNDSCCKKVLCDVTLEDHEPEKDESRDTKKRKLLSARFLNGTTIELNFDTKLASANDDDDGRSLHLIEASSDRKEWEAYKIRNGMYVEVKDGARFLKMENNADIVEIKGAIKSQNTGHCSYKDQSFNIGDEYNDNCTALCVCKESGMKCLTLECPTYFGVDVLDPNCVEWETVPPNFVPKPPSCCPEELRCKHNGSCLYEGQAYQNWQRLPDNVTGCEKQCYCEMGNVECQNTCAPLTALPPTTLPCPANEAIIGHLPEDECCKYWVCQTSPVSPPENDGRPNETTTQIENTTKYMGPFAPHPTKVPSKILGPLVVYTNKDDDNATDFGQNSLHPPANKPPLILPNENPFFNLDNPTKVANKNQGPFNPNNFNNNNKKTSSKNKSGLFVTPPTNENYIPTNSELPYLGQHLNSNNKKPQVHIHGKGNADELLQFINQHPEIANYPSGSVVEIHNVQKPFPNNPVISQNGRPHQIGPYVLPNQPGTTHLDDLTLEQILQEIHKSANPHGGPDIHPYGTNNGPVLIAPQSPILPPNRQNATFQQGFPGGFPQFQPEQVTVQTLEAVDSHTVRLAFTVPTVIVGLHGRVEVRYTHHNDGDFNNWELQVFAPPNDLIATPQLEFDLLGLNADTEYKIKITITLRDLQNTPTSRIYKIRTPKDLTTTTLPPMIPIEPEMAITDINATWVTVVWRKFTEYELQFIDGVQLRFKEIEGKIYDATPLIHRSVTSYTVENLKPNTKYEVGIFFIPFPGQMTELNAEHMLHFTTANEINTYGFNVTLEISHIKSTSVEIAWSGVPYPEDKYVNIYRAIYQSDSGKEDQSTFKIAKRDSPTKSIIMDLKPGTRYRLWLEVYLTNGKIKTSNVQDFITKPRVAIALGAASQQGDSNREAKGDYYGPLVIVAILAAIALLSTLILLLILVRRKKNKAAITPPTRVSQSAYDNPTYKVEIQQETMGL